MSHSLSDSLHPCLSQHWPQGPLPSPLMNSWIHCPSSQVPFSLSCSLPLSPMLYNWLSCSVCDIITSLPGSMTFHRLWATTKLIVLERERAVCMCVQLMIRAERWLHLCCIGQWTARSDIYLHTELQPQPWPDVLCVSLSFPLLLFLSHKFSLYYLT